MLKRGMSFVASSVHCWLLRLTENLNQLLDVDFGRLGRKRLPTWSRTLNIAVGALLSSLKEDASLERRVISVASPRAQPLFYQISIRPPI